MDRVRYMISDAAGLVNVESHVLRYWEEELELDIPRNELGHRYYTQADQGVEGEGLSVESNQDDHT